MQMQIKLMYLKRITTKKIDIKFKTFSGFRTIITFDYEDNLADIINKFFKEIKKPELIGKTDNKIFFLYNGNKMAYDTKTKAKQFFKNKNPVIAVVDSDNLIGK